MSQILLIISSPRVESYSTRVGRKLAQNLASRPGSNLTVRDLTRQPLPHIDDSFAVARNTPPDVLTSAQKSVLALSDKLLIAVEGIVFGPEVAEKAVSSALARVEAISF
jgi:FMN-dependent NADH-azoreductase